MASPVSQGSIVAGARPRAIRPGWGVALFVLINVGIGLALFALAVLAVVAIKVTHTQLFKSGVPDLAAPPPWVVIAIESMFLLMVGGATLAMRAIERRPLADYGFAPRGAAPRLLQGLASGAALMAILVGLLWALQGLALSPARLGLGPAIGWAAQWAIAFILIGATEEIAMRGYLLRTLARGLGFRWAAAITSLVFMALHLPNPGESPMGLFQVCLIGLVFSFSVWRTGALWWAIGFHAAWDFTQSFVFGVADSGMVSPGALLIARSTGPAWLSGGATGPEGSLLMFVILALAVGIIALTQTRRDHALEARF
jgi:membrane protease YdiL (CAAX protease family)